MKSSPYTFLAQRSEVIEIEGQKIWTRATAVLDSNGKFVDRFHLMCAAIADDIPNLQGGDCVMDWVGKVESGKLDAADVDGNAWVINVKRDKIWFEGLYGQGEGGEVSLSQFKLALKTYMQFLSDPEHKPIEIAFPV